MGLFKKNLLRGWPDPSEEDKLWTQGVSKDNRVEKLEECARLNQPERVTALFRSYFFCKDDVYRAALSAVKSQAAEALAVVLKKNCFDFTPSSSGDRAAASALFREALRTGSKECPVWEVLCRTNSSGSTGWLSDDEIRSIIKKELEPAIDVRDTAAILSRLGEKNGKAPVASTPEQEGFFREGADLLVKEQRLPLGITLVTQFNFATRQQILIAKDDKSLTMVVRGFDELDYSFVNALYQKLHDAGGAAENPHYLQKTGFIQGEKTAIPPPS